MPDSDLDASLFECAEWRIEDRWLLDGIAHPIRPELVPVYRASRNLDKWAVIQALDEHRQQSGEPEQIAYADQRDALDYMDDGSEPVQRE